ncbi:putative ABC transport system permease protein [Blastococcus aurantiacus]|uniref:Putative ABC transport system permease protein n=1 Tax=Blastococcus aurantiacus TaxID=1550231 RepID=A0A1G7N3S7_9ACTN|nr:FtsX-like permease family protein [Blastococcus aurantiacus]SDF68557.1 putative ABC transport system permease protein [Blastococcus aurantiacus]
MRTVVLAQLRTHAARLIASTLAVVIAVGFVVATLVLNETSRSTVLDTVGARYVDAAAVVTSEGGSLAGDVATLEELSSVGAVAAAYETSVSAAVPGRPGSQYLSVQSIADAPQLRWEQLSSGRLPTGTGEVAVTDRARAEVGDVLTVSAYDAGGQATTSEATVTGIVDLRGDPEAGLYARGFVTEAQARDWGATGPLELRIAAGPGFGTDEVVADVTAAVPGDVAVRTGEEQAEKAAAALMGNATALASVLLVFGTIAVVVAGLVIANTFAVLLAQRTRELALLRCVGATARQVRRSVLGEALATGLVSSAVGVAAGIGLAALISAVAGSNSAIPLSGVAVPLYAVLAGMLVGTVVTVLAALAPARAATKVAPLAALRPVDPAPLRSRPGVLRLVLGLLLAVPGTALMVGGAVIQEVLVALPGGVLSFLGIVLLSQRAVPPVVAAAGRLAGRLGGVPARLAAGNATRNPRRTAATATALLIGVTLTSAFVVGAASTRATATAGLDAEFPTDVVVQSWSDDLPTSLPGTLADLDQVARTAPVTGADVTDPLGDPFYAHGVDAAAASTVLRSTDEMLLPRPGEVVLPEWAGEAYSVKDGDTLTLTGEGRSLPLRVLITGEDQAPLLDAGDLRSLAGDTGLAEVWVMLSETDPDAQVAGVDEVTDLVGEVAPDAQVTGLVTMRIELDEILDVLLLVVTGLLAVAVVIALIGVGNTLALSVVERRQENGLLRALGLTRGQLRGLLAWEAVLVAGVASALGVVVGGSYGLIGAASVLGEVGDIVLDVPWLQVGAIVVVATLAGLLASVLPARRAARTSPVAAIAAA